MTSPTLTFGLRVTFFTDWHVGSGTGSGIVDRIIARDPEGFPYVPAKTLRGIWRDGCERLAWALDNGQDGGPWSEWVDHLFGNQPALHPAGEPVSDAPSAAELAVSCARFDDAVRQAVMSFDPVTRAKFLQAFTFLKPGVKIEPGSGRALDKHLRFVEMTRAGASLVAEVSLKRQSNDPSMRHATALLWGGVLLVERLGGKRRRGSGRCRLDIEDTDSLPFQTDKEVRSWLAYPGPSRPSVDSAARSFGGGPQSTATANPPPLAGGTNPAWYHSFVRLTLTEPLIVHKQTVGNVQETLDYVPGTLLLRIIMDRLRTRSCNLWPAVVAGDFLVLPATIEINGKPGRPVPMAIHRLKEGGGFDKAETIFNRFLDTEPPDDPIKAFRSGYVGPTGPAAWLQQWELPPYESLDSVVRTHNTVDDQRQRPTADVGGVYSYEAIPAGATLQSEIRVRAPLFEWLANTLERADVTWEKLLEGEDQGTWRIGRSRKDDYGLAKVKLVLLDRLEPRWDTRPVTLEPPAEWVDPGVPKDFLIVWLLSDTLVRGSTLRHEPAPNALVHELESRLGIKLKQEPVRAGCLDAAVALHRLESWHVPWGLPRPTLLAVRGGSCLALRVTSGTVDPQRLAEIELTGIGDRRGEGYGQVRFNDPLLTSLDRPLDRWTPCPIDRWGGVDEEPIAVARDSAGWAFAQVVEREAWRRQIRQAVQQLAASPVSRREVLGLDLEDDKPSMSQLGGLRAR